MHKLYIHTEDVHNFNAPREIVPIIINLLNPKNVLDVGCGIGTWLKVIEENGISDYLGVDGSYIDKDLLKIPLSKFTPADLAGSWNVHRKFDLVLCLEVVEHLPDSVNDSFIERLTKCADTIIFSAAIPGQGGQNHLNEQWPHYWQKKFETYGYYFHDIIRPLVWNNSKVEWWYRQNIFLLTKEKSSDFIFNCYHPECFKEHVNRLTTFNNDARSGCLGVRQSFMIFVRSIINLFRK